MTGIIGFGVARIMVLIFEVSCCSWFGRGFLSSDSEVFWFLWNGELLRPAWVCSIVGFVLLFENEGLGNPSYSEASYYSRVLGLDAFLFIIAGWN